MKQIGGLDLFVAAAEHGNIVLKSGTTANDSVIFRSGKFELTLCSDAALELSIALREQALIARDNFRSNLVKLGWPV